MKILIEIVRVLNIAMSSPSLDSDRFKATLLQVLEAQQCPQCTSADKGGISLHIH